jgi:hypothetical protein
MFGKGRARVVKIPSFLSSKDLTSRDNAWSDSDLRPAAKREKPP